MILLAQKDMHKWWCKDKKILKFPLLWFDEIFPQAFKKFCAIVTKFCYIWSHIEMLQIATKIFFWLLFQQANWKKNLDSSLRVPWYFLKICFALGMLAIFSLLWALGSEFLRRKAQKICYPIFFANKDLIIRYVKTVRKRMSLYKWPLYDLSWPFFAICMSNFHKTEALTVILRCLTVLT